MCELCDQQAKDSQTDYGSKVVSVDESVGMVLPHDITEIRPGEFKGTAFRKGHKVRPEDIDHLKRIGKEHLYVLEISTDEMHEDNAAYMMAKALAGSGVHMKGKACEGKINLIADKDGLLEVNHEALLDFNMLGEVMCATVHNNTVVKEGQTVAGTRAIPLVVKKAVVDEAVRIADSAGGILSIRDIRKPRAGIVITGSEVYHGKIKDAFQTVITKKIENLDGEITGVHFAPDDASYIKEKMNELIDSGSDLIITTGGMSVDPDDVTRFAIRDMGVSELYYGSPVLPGAMFLVAYFQKSDTTPSFHSPRDKGGQRRVESVIPILGIPACGMYASITVFDLILPRVLAGEKIGRKELAELGHGGLCLKCDQCRYPVCPFGK